MASLENKANSLTISTIITRFDLRAGINELGIKITTDLIGLKKN